MRGVGAELDGGLVGGLSEVGEKVADLFFAGVDDLPRGRLVDGVGDFPTELLKAIAELLTQGLRREGWFRCHVRLRER